MPEWDYNSEEYSKEDLEFELIPEGEHQVCIKNIEWKTTSTGKDMYVIKCEALNYRGSLFFYLVFDPSNTKMTNQFLGRIYDSFDIEEGNLNHNYWVGRWGAAEVIHEPYTAKNGELKKAAKIKKFLTQERQEELGFHLEIPGEGRIPF